MGIVVNDIYEDQSHKIAIDGKVPVYSDWTKYPTDERPTFSVSNADSPSVKHIRYGKDYMAIKIETERQQSGWVFSGPAVRIQ